MFFVGQKVVCVNDGCDYRSGLGAARHHGLRKGEVYTVLTVRREFIAVDKVAKNAWLASRFRPITERKTDISVFKRMLEPKHVREDA